MKRNVDVEKAMNPKVVLLISLVLPGVGQVINRTPARGLIFIFYILLLGLVTINLTGPEHSLIGRYSGGLFVYAISIFDAYKWAVYRNNLFNPR